MFLTGMAQEHAVSFEVFESDVDGFPYYDNFPTYFSRGGLANYYRTLPQYADLQREAPDLEKRLREGISELPLLNTQALKPFSRDLYEAYLIMRKHVSSDTALGLPPQTIK